MDMMQAVSTVGFPIAMCLLLWIKGAKIIEKLAGSIEQNTRAIEQLCRHMENDK